MWVELVDERTQWFKGIIHKYEPSRKKELGRWTVNFAGWPDEPKLYLNLELSKYSFLEHKNNWYLLDKDKAIKKFVNLKLTKHISP